MKNLILKGAIVAQFGSQADFAATLGVQESTVSKVVRGRKALSPEEKARWAEALERPADELFNLNETGLPHHRE